MSKYKEALNEFKNLLNAMSKEDDDFEYHYYIHGGSFDLLDELVEKSIPKRPKPIYNKDMNAYEFQCPHCDLYECRLNDENEQGYGGDYEMPKHCRDCGGALNWSGFPALMLSAKFKNQERVYYAGSILYGRKE
jgi:hypothetical protein